MLFNIAGYFIGASFVLFAFWNITIMWQAIGMDLKELKSFMSKKEEIEGRNKFLKPVRITGYTSLVVGIIVYISGYFT